MRAGYWNTVRKYLQVFEMLERVKSFHESLPKMVRDFDISKRLQKIVESALRRSYYDLTYLSDMQSKKEALKNHILSAMIDERAKDKRECVILAEKIASEILQIAGENLKKFCELYVMWHNSKILIDELKKRSVSR
ncbi:MAG: hypothetical protein QXJ98_00440 [Archaeoglobaceae archaeon]